MSTLTLIFIILKLVGAISWGWFYVLLPTIIEVSIVVLFIILTFIAGIFSLND